MVVYEHKSEGDKISERKCIAEINSIISENNSIKEEKDPFVFHCSIGIILKLIKWLNI